MGVLKVPRNGMADKLFPVEILSILWCSHDGRGRADGDGEVRESKEC